MTIAKFEYIELKNCPLCGSPEKRLLFKANDLLMGQPGEFGVEQCIECDFRFTNPRPPAENIFDYYTKDYHCYRDDRISTNKIIESSASEKIVSNDSLKYSFYGGFWGSRGWVIPNLSKGATVLELGCGSGSFVRECVSRGWNTIGTDLNQDLQSTIVNMGAKFIETNLPLINLSDNHLDAVFAWQVLEHLYQPIETLEEIKRVLKPNGIFAFSVPNSDCWQFNLFKNKWAGLQVPTHVSHFSQKSIHQVVEKSGLKIIGIYAQNTVGCLYPSILLSQGLDNVSLSQQWTSINFVNKLVDRFLSIFISLIFGVKQAERLTVICLKKYD
ncbi:SAM-dependent methyltransferase BT3209 [Geminocystis sp. NIES-3708]|uniref:class I SAM-dependent methyltransferase n=1 Tax=Geminocystis sp. NIES-3708 TaxID=1615909 RepID=UPI0005FC4DEE|nr:class I SAM-dependent methyltransferase [Geminocystis sp. NIES-3708]BAQ61189.1 SAM-dependent methyltransferase BT3209 [Geminocystis sp. NIES-3708]